MNMIYFITAIISTLLILALWKWYKWKFTALSIMMFVAEKYREPTEEEIKHYGKIVVKKMLRIL